MKAEAMYEEMLAGQPVGSTAFEMAREDAIAGLAVEPTKGRGGSEVELARRAPAKPANDGGAARRKQWAEAAACRGELL